MHGHFSGHFTTFPSFSIFHGPVQGWGVPNPKVFCGLRVNPERTNQRVDLFFVYENLWNRKFNQEKINLLEESELLQK